MVREVFVHGHEGQLGSELIKLGARPYDDTIVWKTDIGPKTVINCAAMTDDKRCKENPVIAWASNVDVVSSLAADCKASKSRLIHISTDYVFDGTHGNYAEDDVVNPDKDNVYAITKAAGELAFQTIAPQGSTLVRTQWLFGLKRKAWFSSQMIWNQKGGLTYAPDFAQFLMKLGLSDFNPPRILHYVSWPSLTRPQVAEAYGNVTYKLIPVPDGKPKDTSLRVSDYCHLVHSPMDLKGAINEYKSSNPMESKAV